jgi:glutaminyl-peptide cyclotransferase
MRPGSLTLAVVAATAALLACGDAPDAARGPSASRFDGRAARRLLEWQVRLGPRPAGSPASRRVARRLKRLLPHARDERVPGGLRNVVATVPGRGSSYVVVGAHYDTKDVPRFVGANDGASGTAVVTQLARTLKPHTLPKTVVFVLFDGEESPAGVPDDQFERRGLRGSKVAARRYRRASAMVLIDFVGNKHLRIPREDFSSVGLWRKLRRAARLAGASSSFPPQAQGGVLDDHTPFIRRGIPSIDLIDFDFPCFHRPCDDLNAVSEQSLDRVGETMVRYLASL